MQTYPEAIGNIRCEILFQKKDTTTYCIGNEKIDNYIFVNEQQKDAILAVLKHMDGSLTFEEIQDALVNKYNIKVDVEKLYELCKENGFLKYDDPDEVFVKKSFKELEIFMVNIFTIKLHKIQKYVEFLSVHMRAVILSMAVICAVMTGVLAFSNINFNTINWTPLLTNATAIVFYVIVSLISVFLHEFSHVVTAYKYGIKPETITIALYAYVTPMVYVRLAGLYFIEPKKRIAIWASGAVMNLFLGIVSFALANITSNYLQLFFITAVTVNLVLGIMSLFPIFISDGYYILTTILKAPNLRKSSFAHVLNLFKGKINKDSIVYILFCIAFVSVLLYFISILINRLVIMFIGELGSGATLWQAISSNINILIFICIGIISKITTLIMKSVKGQK